MKRQHPVNADAREDCIYGSHVVEAWVRHRPSRVRILLRDQKVGTTTSGLVSAASRVGIRIEPATRDQLDSITRGARHQGVVARCAPFPYADLADLAVSASKLLLLLDQINDPQNLGAIVRSAAAFGAAGVVIPRDGAAAVTAAVEYAAAGCTAIVPICRVPNLARLLEELKLPELGYWSVALDAGAQSGLQQLALPDRVALVIGGETGVRRLVRERCDFAASIPMKAGVESLNASVAAAIALYEVNRQWDSLTR